MLLALACELSMYFRFCGRWVTLVRENPSNEDPVYISANSSGWLIAMTPRRLNIIIVSTIFKSPQKSFFFTPLCFKQMGHVVAPINDRLLAS